MRYLRKILLSLTLSSLLLTSAAFATDYTQDANCQGAWLFTEGSGTTVADSSQNSNTGNFKGSGEPAWSSTVPTFGEGGSPSYSVLYDAADDYINVGNNSSINNLQPITFVAWIYPETYGESTSGGYLFGKRDSSFIKKALSLYSSGGAITIYDYVGTDGTTHQYMAVNDSISANTWQHIAWAFTAPGTAKIYRDGSELSYQLTNGSGTAVDDSGAELLLGNNNLYARTFDGNMTEVAIFDRILNSTEINDIIDNGLVGGAAPSPYYYQMLMGG